MARLLAPQPWIASAKYDLAWMVGPAFVAVALALGLQFTVGPTSGLPVWGWAVLVLGIDVAHVYSTLFRTYWHPQESRDWRTLLWLIPLCCWVGGALLYSVDALWFWRVLAYIAVFHFIRQQYGFMAIYARKDPAAAPWHRTLDATVLYLSMLFPLAYWHTHLPRAFHWFIPQDFIPWPAAGLEWGIGALLAVAAVAYGIKEWVGFRRTQWLNLPKNLVILGTALTWTVGIIAFDDDLTFTLTNVVAHGIPYMALVWVYSQPGIQAASKPAPWRFPHGMWGTMLSIIGFTVILWLLAYAEEGLWDGLVWREHGLLFPAFQGLPALTDRATLSWLVPLLAVPQATHYVLDGFIWRLKGQKQRWANTLAT